MLVRAAAIVLAASVFTHAAVGADLPSRAALPPLASPPLFTWTGFYLGFNAGYVTKSDRLDGTIPDLDAVLPGAGAVAVRQAADGFAGGGQLGYNYQFGASRGVVVGVETDLALTDLNRTTLLPLPPGVPLQASYRSRLDELGTLRGRLGVGVDSVLLYGTGGFAYGQASRVTDLAAGGATIARMTVDDLDVGYAVGGGIEYALPAGRWLAALPGSITLRGEYLHYDLGQHSTLFSAAGQQDTAVRMRNEGDLGRAGVNYKF